MIIKGKLIECKRTVKKYENGHKSDEKLFITVADAKLTAEQQEELNEAFKDSGKKFTPDWVKDFKGYINVATKFELPVLLPDGGTYMSIEDAIAGGLRWMGAAVSLSLVVKEGAVYPDAIKIREEGKEVNPFRAFENED